MHTSFSVRRGITALILAFAVAFAGTVVAAVPAEAAAADKVTISKIKAKTAPYKGKVTIKPNVAKTGKVEISKKTLTVKKGSKTVASNKTSVKLAAGTYKVTQKVTYRTYTIKTTTKEVKKKVVGVPAYTDVRVTCVATAVTPDYLFDDEEPWAAWVNASCTSPKFDGKRVLSTYLYNLGSEWWGFDDDNLDELTIDSLPAVGATFSAILNPEDDLMKTSIVKQKVSTKVYSKVKTKTSKAQTLVIKQGKKPTSVVASGWDCPRGYPIKGNASSGIYHVPGGAYYSRTKPEECFATEAAARNAGYRKSKR